MSIPTNVELGQVLWAVKDCGRRFRPSLSPNRHTSWRAILLWMIFVDLGAQMSLNAIGCGRRLSTHIYICIYAFFIMISNYPPCLILGCFLGSLIERGQEQWQSAIPPFVSKFGVNHQSAPSRCIMGRNVEAAKCNISAA